MNSLLNTRCSDLRSVPVVLCGYFPMHLHTFCMCMDDWFLDLQKRDLFPEVMHNHCPSSTQEQTLSIVPNTSQFCMELLLEPWPLSYGCQGPRLDHPRLLISISQTIESEEWCPHPPKSDHDQWSPVFCCISHTILWVCIQIHMQWVGNDENTFSSNGPRVGSHPLHPLTKFTIKPKYQNKQA